MIDKADHLADIEHAKGAEKSTLTAYKLDDADGIAERIGFNSNMLSKADYFIEQELHVQFIELSDFRETLKNCRIKANAAKTTFDEINKNPELTKK